MTPRTLLLGLAIASGLAPRASGEGTSSASTPAVSEQALRAKQRLLQAEAAVLERLVRRHRSGDDLSGAVMVRDTPPAKKGWPSQAEVDRAKRALVHARALLLQKKAARVRSARDRTAAAAAPSASSDPAPATASPPKTTSDPIEAGTYFYRAGAYAEALAAWKRVSAAKIGQTPERLLRYGGAAEYSGDHALARTIYHRVRARFPHSRQASDAGFRLRFLAWAADLEPEKPESGAPLR